MKKQVILAVVAASFLGTSLVAQAQVIPNDHRTQEGSSSTSLPFFAGPYRWQQCASESKGRPARITSISFRRAVWPGRNSASAPVTPEIKMGQADFDKLTTSFDSNWIGTPVTVFSSKTINTPDWSMPSRTFPALFDFKIALDRQYIFNGANSLLIETAQTGARLSFTQAGLNGVFYRENDEVCAAPRTISTGCNGPAREITSNYSFCSLFSGRFSDARCFIRNAPANAPAAFLIGVRNLNLTIPGLCEKLISSGDLSFSLGLTDSRGSAGLRLIAGPYDGSATGTPIYTQALALDAQQSGIPVVMSAAQESRMPNRTSPIVVRSMSAIGATTKTSTGVRDGGVVMAIN